MSKKMSTGTIVALCSLGAFLLFTVITVFSVIGINNTAVKAENGIKAQYEQNQNNLSQYSNKVMEAAQVPSMYKDDFKEVLTGALTGRYGKDGSKAAFQWIKEHDIKFDSSLYTKIQNIIESGRDRFETDQKLLIDKKRLYATSLETFPNGMVLGALGFPKIDLDEYKIVKSGYANDAFKSGVEDGIKLR